MILPNSIIRLESLKNPPGKYQQRFSQSTHRIVNKTSQISHEHSKYTTVQWVYFAGINFREMTVRKVLVEQQSFSGYIGTCLISENHEHLTYPQNIPEYKLLYIAIFLQTCFYTRKALLKEIICPDDSNHLLPSLALDGSVLLLPSPSLLKTL